VTTGVREWLPWDVMTHEVVRETVQNAVAHWNAQWFTTAYAQTTGIRAVKTDARPDGDGSGWRVYRTSLGVRTSTAAVARLVNRALDLRTDVTEPTEADRHVLDRFEQEILANLADAMEVAFGVAGQLRPEPQKPTDPCPEGGILVPLADPSGREVLTVAIPRDLVVQRVKASIPRTPGAGSAVSSRVAALSDIRISVEAEIGKAELSLRELEDLAVGDVLVLDRRLDEPVDLVGARAGDVFAKAVLTNVEDALALVFSA